MITFIEKINCEKYNRTFNNKRKESKWRLSKTQTKTFSHWLL